MAEIMLALGRDDTRALIGVNMDLLEEVHGLKMLDDEIYKMDDEKVIQAAISRLARSRGVRNIFADTKFAIDTPFEMIDGIDKATSSYLQTTQNQSLRKYIRIPDYISTVVDLPEVALNTFGIRARELGVASVCHVTPSRYTKKDYRNRQTTPEKNARWKIKLFTEAEHSIGAVVCAAADAKIIREARPDLFIFATGAYLSRDEHGRHPAGAAIQEVAEFADVLIIGSPILSAESPSHELERRLLLAK